MSNVGKSEILNYSLCCPFHRFHSSHECQVPQKQRSTCVPTSSVSATPQHWEIARVSQKSEVRRGTRPNMPGCPGVLDPSALLSSHEWKDPGTHVCHLLQHWEIASVSQQQQNRHKTEHAGQQQQHGAMLCTVQSLQSPTLSTII